MLDDQGHVKMGYTDYKRLPEIEFAKKYFDWKFYSKHNEIPIKNESDCYDYLMKLGFGHDTLYKKEEKERKEYAKQMSYDNLVE